MNNIDTEHKAKAVNPQRKARYWSAVLYPENMLDDWRNRLGELIQLPYAYCIHDKDVDSNGNPRKTHVHLMVAFPNTTTHNHAKSLLSALSKEGQTALSTIEPVIGVRYMYNYLVHDSEDSKKKGKHRYDDSERITGNGFDIGSYEQISLADKHKLLKELCDLILQECISNFADLYYLASKMSDEHFLVLQSNSGLLERLTKGVWQKLQYANAHPNRVPIPKDSDSDDNENEVENMKVDIDTGEIID